MTTHKSVSLSLVLLGSLAVTVLAAEPAKPLRVLYITGGCCHDYNREKVIIAEGVTAPGNVEFTIVQEEGSGEKHKDLGASLYQKLTRGLLWACDKLDDSGLPKPGYEAAPNK